MLVRPVSLDDFEELYTIGRNTPELQVSATEDFMTADEFRWSIHNPHGVFLLAENDTKIAGFVYANTKNTLERPLEHKYACLVYLTVVPEFREHGVAKKLYAECEKKLKERGISSLYGWAHAEETSKIRDFMTKQGFTEGHHYIWVEKKLE